MKKLMLLIATAIFLLTDADAFDTLKIKNNKEAFSRELTKKDLFLAKIWQEQNVDIDEPEKKIFSIISSTINELDNNGKFCELRFIKSIEDLAKKNKLIDTIDDLFGLISYSRREQIIDDIFFKILKNSLSLYLDFHKELIPSRSIYRQETDLNLEYIFLPIRTWPDDKTKCTNEALNEIISRLKYKNKKDRDAQLSKLNHIAFKKNLIDRNSFRRIEALNKHKVIDWTLSLDSYLEIIKNSKDVMTNVRELSTQNIFSIKYISRRERLTQRSHLLNSFTSTQIIILAQIVERTSKRMSAKNTSINWEYSEADHGELEIYVLSPMEQYRAAIKMLKKEMAEIMRSDIFQNKKINYEDLIVAAFETGYIKSNEIDYILGFEDFWNPKTPKWKAYMNMALTITGNAAFYLPPPWNTIGAIGLMLTQSRLIQNSKKPNPDDNWNIII